MKMLRIFGAVWGIVGITLILGGAIIRISPHVVDAINIGLTPIQWVILIVWSLYMLVTEGYMGFQKSLSPRFAARSWHLANHGRPIDLILAPLYCVGYFHASRKRIITSWILTVAIVLFVIVVRLLAQPWRGIIDSGVVLGLFYGLVWIYIFTFRTFKNRDYVIDPELVEDS